MRAIFKEGQLILVTETDAEREAFAAWRPDRKDHVFWFDGAGHPHTEKLHTIERIRRPDLGHLNVDITIEDPGAYTKPFTIYGHMAQLVNTEIMEYICDENNVDLPHIVGKDSRK